MGYLNNIEELLLQYAEKFFFNSYAFSSVKIENIVILSVLTIM